MALISSVICSYFRKHFYFVGLLVFAFVVMCSLVLSYVQYSNLLGLRYKGEYIDTGNTTSWPHSLSLSSNNQILLVTYGRSGSTFTSALISRHDDVFFVFEPLFVLKSRNQQPGTQKDSVAIVNAFLSCYIPDQYIFALDNYQHRNSDSTKSFYSCLVAKTSGMSHVTCFLEFLDSCRNHKTTFVKTIRFRVKWAETLLRNNPNFKLLYLVRDPRATLFSQARVFRQFDWRTQIHNASQQHCSRLETDLKDVERLLKLFPGQVKGIRYEQGALNAISYTKDIYNFIGLNYNDDIARFAQNITYSSDDDSTLNDAFSVVRLNSSKTMEKWRYGAGYRSVSEIDRNCRHLYSKLGYRSVLSQRDLESGRSLVETPKSGGIFS